jgi:hypothetical protein
MDLAVRIGGYVVQIHEPENHPCLVWPLRPFDAFLIPSSPQPDLHVEVAVVAHLPELLTGPIRFDSAHGCWKLFESESGLLFESLDPKTFQPRVRALVSDDYRTVRAWILPDLQGGQVGWSPMQLFNPLIEVCLLSHVAREGGLLLHAAGLSFYEQGYVFTGASGTGKSTIAELFANRGAAVLSDERLILRKSGKTFSLYGTPWVGSGNYAENSSAPITGLYCINHGQDRHRIQSLAPSKSMTLLLQQAFVPYWDRIGLESMLDFLASLTTQVPCYSLAFLKQADVVDLLYDCPSPIPMATT